MKDILEFTSLKGTNFLLAWHKIVSIAFIKTDEENATPPCAIIRIENAGTIERKILPFWRIRNNEPYLSYKQGKMSGD